MLSQRLLDASNNELINDDNFTTANELVSIHIDSGAINDAVPTPSIVAPIYLTNTTAKLEKLLNDMSEAEANLEKNIDQAKKNLLLKSSVVIFFIAIGSMLTLDGSQNDELSTVLAGIIILICSSSYAAWQIQNDHHYPLDREELRRHGKYYPHLERLRQPLTEDEVEQIQRTAESAGISQSYTNTLNDVHAMRKASAEFIRQRENILKTVHRNHAIESVLNALSIPSVISELVLDYDGDSPTMTP